MDQNGSKRSLHRFQLIASIIIFICAGWILLNRQFVVDQIALLKFTPTSEIAALSDSTGMTSKAERYFYASRPQISEPDSFNSNCQSSDKQTIILGCYTGGRIFVFNIQDERLAGIKEVTAAHEMLHAAYERIGDSEKKRVNSLIDNEVQILKDTRILALIDIYNRTEPGQLQNEMHSILATEVQTLSPELEEYYEQYFSNRQTVVAYSLQYETVFSELKNRQQQLVTELNVLNATIKTRSDALNARITQLNTDIATFNRRASDGEFSSQTAFNQERQSLIDAQEGLQNERMAIDTMVDEFNTMRDELIALNGEVESLNQSLDSTPNTVPSL